MYGSITEFYPMQDVADKVLAHKGSHDLNTSKGLADCIRATIGSEIKISGDELLAWTFPFIKQGGPTDYEVAEIVRNWGVLTEFYDECLCALGEKRKIHKRKSIDFFDPVSGRDEILLFIAEVRRENSKR